MFPEFFMENEIVLALLSFILILTVMHFPCLRSNISLMISASVSVLLLALHIVTLSFEAFDYRSYLLVIGIQALRHIADKYNYAEIPTEDVRKGYILSMNTVVCFIGSKINGLPMAMTEDLRSRLSEEEAESVVRWKGSKQGSETVTIVKKIPFAIFIALGVLVFLILEVKQ